MTDTPIRTAAEALATRLEHKALANQTLRKPTRAAKDDAQAFVDAASMIRALSARIPAPVDDEALVDALDMYFLSRRFDISISRRKLAEGVLAVVRAHEGGRNDRP